MHTPRYEQRIKLIIIKRLVDTLSAFIASFDTRDRHEEESGSVENDGRARPQQSRRVSSRGISLPRKGMRWYSVGVYRRSTTVFYVHAGPVKATHRNRDLSVLGWRRHHLAGRLVYVLWQD